MSEGAFAESIRRDDLSVGIEVHQDMRRPLSNQDAILWHVASRGDRFPVRQIETPPPAVSILASRELPKRGPRDGAPHAGACVATLAIRAGTPNSLAQTSASTAMPSRISSWEGLAKHSRSRLPA
jgi:hypothetical protein